MWLTCYVLLLSDAEFGMGTTADKHYEYAEDSLVKLRSERNRTQPTRLNEFTSVAV